MPFFGFWLKLFLCGRNRGEDLSSVNRLGNCLIDVIDYPSQDELGVREARITFAAAVAIDYKFATRV